MGKRECWWLPAPLAISPVEIPNIRCLRAQYPLFAVSPEAADGRLRRWVYGGVFALPQPLGGAIFSGSDTRSVYGRTHLNRAPRHKPPTLGATCLLVTATQSNGRTAIRPFTIETPEADLEDLRARVVATRFPEKETVEDSSQGPRLATMQALARYWAEDYDWEQVRGETEGPTALHHRDRRPGHPFHSRSLGP